jgi:hypothetical protein
MVSLTGRIIDSSYAREAPPRVPPLPPLHPAALLPVPAGTAPVPLPVSQPSEIYFRVNKCQRVSMSVNTSSKCQ